MFCGVVLKVSAARAQCFTVWRHLLGLLGKEIGLSQGLCLHSQQHKRQVRKRDTYTRPEWDSSTIFE